MDKDLEKRKLEGFSEAKRKIILSMLKNGMSISEIANILEISTSEVEKFSP